MSGQAAFDKPVRPAALCILGAAGKQELNGIGEVHDDMSDEEGDRIESARLASESRTQEQANAEGERRA